VICDHAVAGVDLDDNPARRLAGFRQLLPDTRRVPAADRADHVWYLATRLNIDPTIAAAEATAHHPSLFADRPTDGIADAVVHHCRQLAAQLTPQTRLDPLQQTDSAMTVTIRRAT
jgi:hypothetical protein